MNDALANRPSPAASGYAILVFARQPRPGRVKTRLAKDIGDAAACRVYQRLLSHTLSVVSEVTAWGGVPVARWLYLPEGDTYPVPGFLPAVQRGPGLGACMSHAFSERLGAGTARVLLVGSDLPELCPAHLTEGLEALATHDTVFGPARDGGYWLVGQRPPARDLFSGLTWSHAQVWAQTRARLLRRGWSHHTLPVLEDVDELPAWERLRSRLPG